MPLFKKKDGKIWITTETRNYQGDDDYIDSADAGADNAEHEQRIDEFVEKDQ